MIQKWRDNKFISESCAALLTDLVKAFECNVYDPFKLK